MASRGGRSSGNSTDHSAYLRDSVVVDKDLEPRSLRAGAQVVNTGGVGNLRIDGAKGIDGMGGVRTAAARFFPATLAAAVSARQRPLCASRSTLAPLVSTCSSIRWCVRR